MNNLKLISIRPFSVSPTSPFLFRYLPKGTALDPAKYRRSFEIRGVHDGALAARSELALLERGAPKPILMLEHGDGPLILDGHRRMAAAYLLGLDLLPALIYPKETPKRDVAFISLSAASEAGDLTGIEKAIAIYKTAIFVQDSFCREKLPIDKTSIKKIPLDIISLYSTLIGRGVSETFLLRCVEMLTLPERELELLHTQALSIENILPLLDLSSEERLVLLEIRALSPLSASQTRELARLLLLARGREDMSLGQWAEQILEALRTRRAKTNPIQSLRRKIYPNLCEREGRITLALKAMRLPANLRIRAPEDLEGESFSCYFKFSNITEFNRILAVLQKAGESGKIRSLIDELNAADRR